MSLNAAESGSDLSINREIKSLRFKLPAPGRPAVLAAGFAVGAIGLGTVATWATLEAIGAGANFWMAILVGYLALSTTAILALQLWTLVKTEPQRAH